MKQATTPTIVIRLKGQGSMLLDALNQTGGINVYIKNESGFTIRADKTKHHYENNPSGDNTATTNNLAVEGDAVKVSLSKAETKYLLGNNLIEMTIAHGGKTYKTATRKFVVEPALWIEPNL